MMFTTDKGASGSLVVSQISAGRKNRLWFELDGSQGSVAFDQEEAERLWVSSRDQAGWIVRDPGTLSPAAARYAFLPGGHAQGYADCFDAFVADTYAAIRNGEGADSVDGLPAFADGERAARITDAVLASAATESPIDVS
jgi:predicted dehydrogenase